MKKLILFILLVGTFVGCSKTDTPTVTPTPTKSSANNIKTFELGSLNPKVSATIDDSKQTITAIVPFGTDLRTIAPTITVSDKATVSPSTATVNDLSLLTSYTVTAEDGSAKIYTVSIEPETRLLFYNTAKGSITVTDNKTFTSIGTNTQGTNWTSIVSIRPNQILFYDSKTGKSLTVDNKTFATISESVTEPNLENPQVFNGYVLFFDSKNLFWYFKDGMTLNTIFKFPSVAGTNKSSNAIGSKKDRYISYSPVDGTGVLVDIKSRQQIGNVETNFGKNWTNLVGADEAVLAYNSATGAARIFSQESPFSTLKDFTMASGWTIIINVGNSQVLFFNSKTGESMLTDDKTFTKVAATFPTTTGTWTHVAAL